VKPAATKPAAKPAAHTKPAALKPTTHTKPAGHTKPAAPKPTAPHKARPAATGEHHGLHNPTHAQLLKWAAKHGLTGHKLAEIRKAYLRSLSKAAHAQPAKPGAESATAHPGRPSAA
jgi:hypothetical protein